MIYYDIKFNNKKNNNKYNINNKNIKILIY